MKTDRPSPDRGYPLRIAASAALCVTLPALSVNARSPIIQFVHARTGKQLEVRIDRLPSPLVINHFFYSTRDRRFTQLDPRLLVIAAEAARRFDRQRVRVISAFRTKRVNEALRRAGRNVALHSRHIHGQALDFQIPGVTVEQLCRHLRARRPGGLGCYFGSHFVHVDVGPKRYWRQ